MQQKTTPAKPALAPLQQCRALCVLILCVGVVAGDSWSGSSHRHPQQQLLLHLPYRLPTPPALSYSSWELGRQSEQIVKLTRPGQLRGQSRIISGSNIRVDTQGGRGGGGAEAKVMSDWILSKSRSRNLDKNVQCAFIVVSASVGVRSLIKTQRTLALESSFPKGIDGHY